MKEYILINRVPANYGQAEAKEVSEAWKKVTDQWRDGGIFVNSFVFPGPAINLKGNLLDQKNGDFKTNDSKIVSMIVIKTEDCENAGVLAKSSPILQQQGSVEVREIMTRPPSPIPLDVS